MRAGGVNGVSSSSCSSPVLPVDSPESYSGALKITTRCSTPSVPKRMSFPFLNLNASSLGVESSRAEPSRLEARLRPARQNSCRAWLGLQVKRFLKAGSRLGSPSSGLGSDGLRACHQSPTYTQLPEHPDTLSIDILLPSSMVLSRPSRLQATSS